MKLQQQEFNTRGKVPLLYYKLDPTVGIKPETMYNPLKVDINTQLINPLEVQSCAMFWCLIQGHRRTCLGS